MRKVLISILLIVSILLSSCDKEEQQPGAISYVPDNESEIEQEEPIEDDPSILNNGFVKLSFPIPDGFKIEYKEANIVRLSNGTQTIYLEHLMSRYNEYLGFDLSEAVQAFNGRLLVETFRMFGKSFSRAEDQVPKVRENGLPEVNDDDLVRLRYDFPNLNITNDIGTDVSESRYYIFDKNGSTVISIIGPKELYEKSAKILDEMVDSITEYNEIIDEIKTISIGGIELDIPIQFRRQSTNLYLVLSRSQSIYSGSFVCLLEYPLTEVTPEIIMSNVFPDDIETMELPSTKYSLESFLGYDDKEAAAYYTNIYRTAIPKNWVLSHGLTFIFDMLDLNGKTLVIGYPVYASEAIVNSMYI